VLTGRSDWLYQHTGMEQDIMLVLGERGLGVRLSFVSLIRSEEDFIGESGSENLKRKKTGTGRV